MACSQSRDENPSSLDVGNDVLAALRLEAEALARVRRDLLGLQQKAINADRQGPSERDAAELPRLASDACVGQASQALPSLLSEAMVKFATGSCSQGRPIAGPCKPKRVQPHFQISRQSLQNPRNTPAATQQELEAEIGLMSCRCAVLERCLQDKDSGTGNDTESDHCSGAQRSTVEGLQQEIARYALEVRQLRAERQQVRNKLRGAQAAEEQHAHEHGELQQTVDRLTQDTDHLEYDHANLVATLTRESARCHVAEEGQRDAKDQYEVLVAAMEVAQAHSHVVADVNERQLAAVKQSMFEREARVHNALHLARPLYRAVTNFERDYCEILQEYADFISKVQALTSVTKDDLENAREALGQQSASVDIVKDELLKVRDMCRKTEEQELQEEASLRQRCEEARIQCKEKVQSLKVAKESRRDVDRKLAELTPLLHERQKRLEYQQQRLKQRPGALMLETALRKNIAKEMHAAQKGMFLEKIKRKNDKREIRFVAMLAMTHELKWGKAPNNFESSLDLREIIHIDYGTPTVRPCILCKDVPPWLCFSLYTLQRSFDFICPDEQSARCFVLAISRFAPWASGAVRTRGQFEARKGWCKVEEYCFREHKTLIQVLLEAVAQTAPAGSLPQHLRSHRNSAQPGYPAFSMDTPSRTRLSRESTSSRGLTARSLSFGGGDLQLARSIKDNLKTVGARWWK